MAKSLANSLNPFSLFSAHVVPRFGQGAVKFECTSRTRSTRVKVWQFAAEDSRNRDIVQGKDTRLLVDDVYEDDVFVVDGVRVALSCKMCSRHSSMSPLLLQLEAPGDKANPPTQSLSVLLHFQVLEGTVKILVTEKRLWIGNTRIASTLPPPTPAPAGAQAPPQEQWTWHVTSQQLNSLITAAKLQTTADPKKQAQTWQLPDSFQQPKQQQLPYSFQNQQQQLPLTIQPQQPLPPYPYIFPGAQQATPATAYNPPLYVAPTVPGYNWQQPAVTLPAATAPQPMFAPQAAAAQQYWPGGRQF